MEDVVSLFAPYRIEKGDTIVVGVSGGPDSMALLSMLLSIEIKKRFKSLLLMSITTSVERVQRKESL